ncbi:MAG: hypothetical protein A6F72_03775 [Cycloclasticus sp. symbiont of Poecilosclerida sp. N]|nr:MAG: hypothetical protein A6F72_03675 [Cycloclasticus sp. symbiont of Poecilosclerida sp. N]ORU91855.1 MAG: hypothetical protein A6F72_03775 [Cycloclasticus sp. symbiont of Poecilosclerida sp. N]
MFGFHSITPALYVLLKSAYSLWLNLAEVKRDRNSTTADDLLIVTPLDNVMGLSLIPLMSKLGNETKK